MNHFMRQIIYSHKFNTENLPEILSLFDLRMNLDFVQPLKRTK